MRHIYSIHGPHAAAPYRPHFGMNNCEINKFSCHVCNNGRNFKVWINFELQCDGFRDLICDRDPFRSYIVVVAFPFSAKRETLKGNFMKTSLKFQMYWEYNTNGKNNYYSWRAFKYLSKLLLLHGNNVRGANATERCTIRVLKTMLKKNLIRATNFVRLRLFGAVGSFWAHKKRNTLTQLKHSFWVESKNCVSFARANILYNVCVSSGRFNVSVIIEGLRILSFSNKYIRLKILFVIIDDKTMCFQFKLNICIVHLKTFSVTVTEWIFENRSVEWIRYWLNCDWISNNIALLKYIFIFKYLIQFKNKINTTNKLWPFMTAVYIRA